MDDPVVHPISATSKLSALGLTVAPYENLQVGRFLQAKQVGDIVYTAGQISRWEGHEIKGKVGEDVTLEQAKTAARYCALNCLRAVLTVAGSLDHVSAIAKVVGMVNVAPGFDSTPAVIDGASELLNSLFEGGHARTAIGVTVPYGWSVEVELIAQLAR